MYIVLNALFRCNYGYVLPFCSPDPTVILKGEISPMELNASLSSWSDLWGYEKCSLDNERYVFSNVQKNKEYLDFNFFASFL